MSHESSDQRSERTSSAVLSRLRADLDRGSVLEGWVAILAILFALWTIYYAYSMMWMRLRYSNVFLGLGLSLYYFDVVRRHLEGNSDSDDGPDSTHDVSALSLRGRFRRVAERLDPFVAGAFGVLALAASAYVEYHFQRLLEDVHLLGHTQVDLYVGVVLIVLVIDATRRAFGNVIAAVAVASIVYAHEAVGPRLPGVLQHTGFDWTQIARQGAIELTGVYHATLMGIGSTWVAIFIIFAGIAKAYGLMDFVIDVGRELSKTLRTGVVQIAVIASMIMGSITGSAAANTATTGSFTIPMMQDQGLRNEVAGAVESVASAGGQMLPPVMGVAAFLMADILGVRYLAIIRAGTIPAVLFYISVAVAVHFAVLKYGWTTPNTDTFDWSVLWQGIHFAVPIGVLIVYLVVLQYTPLSAGLYTVAAILVVGSVKMVYDDFRSRTDEPTMETTPNRRLVAREGGRIVVETARALRRGGLEMAPLVGVLAAMGIIIEMVTVTGLAPRVSTTIIGLGGGSLLVVLLLAMVASILFGLGMPTPAAYILVVVLVAPGVIEMGVPELTTHMFVFYFAMLSAITPPVAISVAIGARIAGADFMRTAVQALRIGAAGFFIPFAFITNNSLIYWQTPETVLAFASVFVGIVALIVATIGYDGDTSLALPSRVLFFAGAMLAMFGGVLHGTVQLGVAGLLAVRLVWSNYYPGRSLPASITN